MVGSGGPRQQSQTELLELRRLDLGRRLGERIAASLPAFRELSARAPGLAVVLVGDDPASEVYVRSKGTQTRAAGMASFADVLSKQDALAIRAFIAADQRAMQ